MAWLNSWNGFVKVVQTGSMAAAARSLGCTRAQISKQVADLEQAFGVRLFERSTRKLGLTPSGAAFYRHALLALEAVEHAEVAVKNLGDAPRGVLRIAATLTFGRMHVAPLLPVIAERYPELTCELILSDQLADLVDDNIDLALRMTKAPPEDAVARKLADIRRVICGAPAYLAKHGAPQTPQDLTAHQCFSFLLSDDNTWNLVDASGQETSIPVRSRFQYNTGDCLLQAVLDGHGLAILPTYLCGPEIAKGNLQTVLDGWEPDTRFGRHLYACYTPSRVRAPKVRVFLEELERRFQPVPIWER